MENLKESTLVFWFGRGPLRSLDRIERNRIDMRPIISIVVQTLRQQFGMFRLVVDAAHQGVFDADSPFGSQIIIMRSVEHLFGVETLVHGHKFIAQFIARRVQGYCETYWDAFFGQFPDARHHANGGNRDVTCGDAEAFGRHGTNLADCTQDGFIVAHWFAHAHEHDVAQSSGASGHFTVTHGLRGHTNLLNDFTCGHVPGQSQLSSGAEWATHAAADLAGNAKKVGDYFAAKLEKLPHVKEVRHQGLLVGVEFDDTIGGVDVKHGCLDRHLLITAIGAHIIRMIPPLIVTEEECDKAVAIIEDTIKSLEK